MSLEGQKLGRYHLRSLIDSGGMGEVYLAEDIQVNRQVAAKVIKIEAALQQNSEAEANPLRLFLREATAIASLDHPNILTLYDYGDVVLDNQHFAYLITPYRSAGSLINWLHARISGQNKQPLTLKQTLHILQQASGGLQYAHDHQLIHKDVKPANFLIRNQIDAAGYPDLQLADFGVAQLASTISNASQSVRGTPTYMAPEQWAGKAVFASDQYALGVMAYELFTGSPLFQGSPMNMMYAHLHNAPKLPREINPLLPPAFNTILLRALAKNPDERFPSVTAFAQACQQALQDTGDTITYRSPQAAPVTPPPPAPQSANDIRATLSISVEEARSGTTRTLNLAGGRLVSVQIPPGIQNGQVITLANMGLLAGPGSSPGHLHLTLSIIEAPEPSLASHNATATVLHPSAFDKTTPETPPGPLNMPRTGSSGSFPPRAYSQPEPLAQSQTIPNTATPIPAAYNPGVVVTPPANDRTTPYVYTPLSAPNVYNSGVAGSFPANDSRAQSQAAPYTYTPARPDAYNPSVVAQPPVANQQAQPQAPANPPTPVPAAPTPNLAPTPPKGWRNNRRSPISVIAAVLLLLLLLAGGFGIFRVYQNAQAHQGNATPPVATNTPVVQQSPTASASPTTAASSPTAPPTTSVLGVNWSMESANTVHYLKAVTWSGSMFVAVGDVGTILTSKDGKNWTVQYSNSSAFLRGINWSGSLFVAVGDNGTILTSPDGINWTSQDLSAYHSTDFTGVVSSKSLFVIVGSNGTILNSPDGHNWTPVTLSMSPAPDLTAIRWNDSIFITVGSNGTILTSTNGQYWIAQQSNTTENLEAIKWANSLFVVVGDNGTIIVSPDAQNWTSRTFVSIASRTPDLMGVSASSGSLFVVVGSEGTIFTSSDTKNWTEQKSGTPQDLEGVASSGSRFVAVGIGGMLLTSP